MKDFLDKVLHFSSCVCVLGILRFFKYNYCAGGSVGRCSVDLIKPILNMLEITLFKPTADKFMANHFLKKKKKSRIIFC